MALPMSDAMIASEYRQAKQKQKQIHILADLNGTDTKTIVEILTREGCELPGNYKAKKAPAEDMRALKELAAAAPVLVPAPNWDEIEQETKRSIKVKTKLAALDTIQDMMPGDNCDENDALWFVERLRGIFALLETMEAQNGR